MDIENLKDVITKSVMVIAYRSGDVDTEDGSFATTGTDEIIRLETALCEALGTKYDDIDVSEAITLIDSLHDYKSECIELRAKLDGFKEVVEAVANIGVDFGFGAFVLGHDHIEKARNLLSHSQE